MKLATLADGSRDGRLVLVSRDGRRLTSASDIAPTLQQALDRELLGLSLQELLFDLRSAVAGSDGEGGVMLAIK